MELSNLRKQINEIDDELIKLIEQRMEIVSKVAEYKKENNLPVYSAEREQAIIANLASKVNNPTYRRGFHLLHGIIMDLSKLNQYNILPKDFKVPTNLGGASVRAILPYTPGSLCRFIATLASANISIIKISSSSLPGGSIVVDIELEGDIASDNFKAALAVLEDNSEAFTIL